MDIQQEKVTVQDPISGTTQTSQSIQSTPTEAEVSEAQANKSNQIIWFIAGVINSLLGLRIIFLLLDARNTGFANFLYSITDPFAAPFKGIFAAPSLSGSYFDSAALLAIVVYSLIAWGIASLVDVIGRPAPR